MTRRQTSVTADSIEHYKDLIHTATSDLEAHLESIDEKLEAIFQRTVTESDPDAAELRLIKDEQLSTQRCLQICARLSDHIDQIRITPQHGGAAAGTTGPNAVPEKVTNMGLQECKRSLFVTSAKLERHMLDLMDRLVTKSRTAMTSEEDVTDLARLREEWETARQCMDICSKADSHLKESISTIDNYATGDAVQFMVSTDGQVIHGTNRGLGWRTRQVGGHLSDITVQQLSRDMRSNYIQHTENESPPMRDDTPSVSNEKVGNKPSPDYQKRYGEGFTLSPRSVPDVPASYTRKDAHIPTQTRP